MNFSPGLYAILTADLLSVREVRDMIVSFDAKEERVRPVVITAQPAFDPATQKVEHTGWIINGAEVNPEWTVVALTVSELDEKGDSDESDLLLAAYQTFKDNNATQAQVQRAIAWLIKQEAKRRGLL